MNAQVSSIEVGQLSVGAAIGGGFFVGTIRVNDELHAIIVAPKTEGERNEVRWSESYDRVDGAKSLNDGLANTDAMAAAGSELGTWARDLRIGGNEDWYLPSQDELEVCYRNLKPTTDEDSCYGRSGMNLHSFPASLPYSHAPVKQTELDAFKSGGAEAFDTDEAYWSSTQHAAFESGAWGQLFDDGFQDYWFKDHELRARAVRRIKL